MVSLKLCVQPIIPTQHYFPHQFTLCFSREIPTLNIYKQNTPRKYWFLLPQNHIFQ